MVFRRLSLLFYTLFFLFLMGIKGLQAQSLEELSLQASQAKGAREKIEIWQEMAFQFLYSQADSSPIYARKSLSLAKEKGLDSLIAEGKLMLGNYFYLNTRLDSALHYYQQAAAAHRAADRMDRYAAALTNMGGLYQNKWNYAKSLELQLEAAQIFTELKDSFRLTTIYGNLANLYDKNEQPRKAIFYARMCQSYAARHLDQGRMKAHFYQGSTIIGGAYLNLGIYDSSVYHQRIAVKGFSEVNDPYNSLSATNNLAYAYEMADKADSAAIFYERATQMALSLEVPDRIVANASNAADIHTRLGNLAKAREYLDLAREQEKNVEDPEALYRLQHTLSNFEEARGNYVQALKAQRLAVRMKDSLNSRERIRSINELTVKYETAEKERKLAETRADLKQRQLYLSWLGASLLGVILLGVVLFVWEKSRRQGAIQKARIAEQKRGLEAVIEATESERRRIARDLHDGVGQELASLQMAFEKLQDSQGLRAMDPLQGRLQEASSQLRSISHQMMPRALESAGLVPALDELVEKSTSGTGLKGNFDAFRVEEVPGNISLVLYRVAQELINNVLKHARASEVDVLLTRTRDQLSLVVEDNGQGMEEEYLKEGLGMTNMRTRLQTIGGSLEYEAADGGGTRALVKVPVDEEIPKK